MGGSLVLLGTTQQVNISSVYKKVLCDELLYIVIYYFHCFVNLKVTYLTNVKQNGLI